MPAPRCISADQTQPLYCQRCDLVVPLGIVAPGRYYLRHARRTMLAQGGTVTVWCPQCSAEYTLDLTDARAMPTASAA